MNSKITRPHILVSMPRRTVQRAGRQARPALHQEEPKTAAPKIIYLRQLRHPQPKESTLVAQAHKKALQETLGALSHDIGEAVSQAMKPVKEGVLLLQAVAAKHKPSRAQAVADVIHRWALPVVQVLLGAAVVVVGASIMEISIMVLGATMCATGLALCITLLAGMLAPHPLDSLRDFVKRRQSHDPEFYSPGMVVALDGGG